MSRYLVDKFLYRVDRSPSAFEAYASSPAEFVERWEREEGPRVTSDEETHVHSFTDEERSALAAQDFERLYAMGAHPFLLWTLMLPILERQHGNFRAVADFYTARIRPYGRPDFWS